MSVIVRIIVRFWFQFNLAMLLAVASMNVLASCSITVTPIANLVYNPLATNSIMERGRATVKCTTGVKGFKVEMSTGQSSSYAQREMRNGNQVLYYNLYVKKNCTKVIGDGSSGTKAWKISLTGNKSGTKNIKKSFYLCIAPRQ